MAAAAVIGVVAAGLGGAGCVHATAGQDGEPPRVVRSRLVESHAPAPRVAREARGYLFELAAPAEEAWAELPAVYESLGLPLAFVDAERWELGNGGWSLPERLDGERPSHWLDCGRGIAATPNADAYDVVMSIRSGITATASGSAVETALTGSAGPRDASGGVVACSSRGTLEERIGELLHERLAKKER